MQTPPPSSPRKLHWQTLVIVVLTLALVWYAFRDLNLGEVWRHILGARIGFIVAAVCVTLLTYLFRARRWQLILMPLGQPRFRTTFRASVIGFTLNFLLPGRAGEFVRAYLVSKQDGFKMSATFATVIIERMFDLSTTLLLFACCLPFLTIPINFWVKFWGVAGGVFALICMGLAFLFAGHPEAMGRGTARLTRRLPAKMAEALTNFVRTFAEGLAVMRSPGRLVMIAIWSVPLWLSITVGIYLTSRAFDITYPYAGAFLVMMFLVVGVSAPTPGGVGAFQWTYMQGVALFGANEDAAGAAAIVLHLVSFVPVTLVGLLFMWQDGLTLGGVKEIRDEAKGTDS